jgi:hypothetical protein
LSSSVPISRTFEGFISFRRRCSWPGISRRRSAATASSM